MLQVRWYQHVLQAGGVKIADGVLCWSCGVALDCWPLQKSPGHTELLERFASGEQPFCSEVLRCSNAAKLAETMKRAESLVAAGRSLGIRCSFSVAFVLAQHFKTFFGCQPED